MKIYLKLLIIILLFSSSCEKDKEMEVRYGDLTGKVVNEFDQSLDEVLIEFDSKTVKTNSMGVYIFKNVPINNYKVTASKEAFLTKSKEIELIENEISTLDFKLVSGKSFLKISDSILSIAPSNKNIKIKVSSNSSWLINENSDWIETSSKNGEGDGEITLNCSENISDKSRIDTVFFSSGEIIKPLVIKQDVTLKLIKIEGIIGNGETEVKDSVFLRFNKPVKVESIKSNWEFCYSDINYKLVNNDKGIMFTYPCADLGGTYPFTIEVKDNYGQSFKEDIEVPFYNNRIDIKGIITCYKINDKENEAWISTHSPNRLIKISLDNFKITKTIELDFYPRSFTINPYNNLLYTLSGYPFNYIYDNTIYVINQQSGLIEKKIKIEPEADDHPQSPVIYPRSIGFTKSGYGVVLMSATNGSGQDWKVIDSSKRDTTYRHKDRGWGAGKYDEFNTIHINHDCSKLLFTEMYGSCNILILDEDTHEIKKVTPVVTSRGGYILPNRKNDKMYVSQLLEQFIIDTDGNMSNLSYIDRGIASADFSYRDGEDGLIYTIDEKYFRLLNYNNSSTPMWCSIIYGLKEFTSSIDGNYAYAYKLNHPDSYFYKFNNDYFYRHIND